MEGFRYAVSAVCIVSAAACLIGNLTAGTKMHKQMKLILDLLIAVVTVMPFAKGTAAFVMPEICSGSAPDSSFALELYNSSLSRMTAENVGSVLRAQIGAAGIECGNIEINVNISEEGSIFISRVTLDCGNFDAAAEIVRNSLGKETEVVNGNTGEVQKYEQR